MKKTIEFIKTMWTILTLKSLNIPPDKCPKCGEDDIAIYGYNGGGWYCRDCET